MNRLDPRLSVPRRAFLRGAGGGLGGIALASLLADESRAATLGQSHFPPRAKRVIFLFMAGAPSQLDLFTPKSELTRLHGQPVPESFLKGLSDHLIRGSARVMASPRKFSRHG